MGALVGFGALLAALRFNSILPLNGDNAVYLLLARNLATGAPYNNAGFPWGYPVLLTPGAALFGPTHLLEAIPWLKLISIAAFLLGLVLLYLLFRTRHGRVLAFLTVALFAANDITLVYTNDLMTELPYVAAVAGALLFWQRRIDPAAVTDAGGPANPGRRAWIGAALLLALPYYLRTIGMALLAAAPLTLLWRRRSRAALVLALALVALALPWAVFSATTDPNRNYTASLWLRDPYNPELGRIAGPGEFAERVAGRAGFYATAVLPPLLLPQPADPANPIRTVGGAVLLVVALGGYGLRLWRRVELPEVYMAGFLAILSSWPWTGDRFLLPVLPFILHYIAEALAALAGAAGRLLRRPRVAWAAPALLALLLVPSLTQDSIAIGANLRYLGGDIAAGGLTVEDRDFLAASVWLRDHTPPGGVVLARKSSIAEIYSGHPAELIPLIPPDQYLAWLRARHVTYVLEDAWPWSRHTIVYLRPAMAAYPAQFRLLHTIPAATPGGRPTRVWQFVPQ
jgi:hypothetical protein